MKDRMLKQFKLIVDGILSIDADGKIYISVVDKGDFLLNELLTDFDGKLVALSCESYKEV